MHEAPRFEIFPILARLDKASKRFYRKHFVAGGDSMDIARTSQTSPAASVPQGGTEDLFRELQPAQTLTGNKVWHLPPPGGRQKKKWCSGECKKESLSSQQQPEPARVGRAGSSPHGRQHKRYYCVNLSPSKGQTTILFPIMSLQLHVEEVRKPAIFLSAFLTHFPRLSLWALQAWRALASCYCSRCSILLWTLSPSLDHKNHVLGSQNRICCTAYCSSARTEYSKLF